MGKEDDSLSNLLRGTNPSLRVEVGDGLEQLVALAAEEELGSRGAGGNGVDQHALPPEVLADDAGHLFYSALGAVVEQVARHDGRCRGQGGGHEDDVGAARQVRGGSLRGGGRSAISGHGVPSLPRPIGFRDAYLGEEVGAFDIDGKGPVKVGFGGVFQVLHRQQARVGNQHVDLGVGINCLFDE